MAIDPGFRTGCRWSVLTLKELYFILKQFFLMLLSVRLPKPRQPFPRLVDKFQIEAISIGNGTAGRGDGTIGTNHFFSHPVQIFVVSENGRLSIRFHCP